MRGTPAFRALGLLASAGVLLGVGEQPPPAPAFDPGAAGRLAERLLDEARGERSRERIRILWPQEAPVPPEPGSEVVLIGGYISHNIVVLRRTDAGVDGRRLSMARSWFYNRKGESFASRSLSFSADEFATRWAAARMVLGAGTERKVPKPAPPEDGLWGGHGSGSHEPEHWIRLRTPSTGAPLYLGNHRGSSWDYEEIPDFEQVRATVLFDLFHEPSEAAARRTGTPDAPVPSPLESWLPFLRTEIERWLSASPPDFGVEPLLLIELCLRALAEIGEESDLALLAKADARLAPVSAANHAARDCGSEIALAIPRIRLRHRWEPDFAARTITETSREYHAQEDLVRRVRALFRERDPARYRSLLLEHLRSATPDPVLLAETIGEVARFLPAEAGALLEPLRTADDPEIRNAVEEALEAKPPPK